jgi:cytochrome c-type biogenesis protein CcmE
LPPDHPERRERLIAIAEALSEPRFDPLERRLAPAADPDVTTLAHDQAYVDLVSDNVPSEGFVRLDPDTYMSPKSLEAVLHAVGAACHAVDEVMGGRATNAFCAVRPPGHHAESRRAMGFCLFNNAVIGARHAQRAHGATRVAIVDWDAHHGNGTQEIVWSDPTVLYASTHQMPLYPGTGAADETGVGNIVNVPLSPKDRVFRVGGMVPEGSFTRESGSLQAHFVLTDFAHNVKVSYTGVLPDLFREGQGVIARGRMGADGVFVAEEVLAKHDENYMPPEVAETLKK